MAVFQKTETMAETEIFAVIVAGGKGARMESSLAKQYLDLAGMPVLSRTLQVFTKYRAISKTVLVIPEQDREFCIDKILKPHNLNTRVDLVSGGKDRQSSVLNGLMAVKAFTSSFKKNLAFKKNLVLIHDGVRPFADHLIIERCLKGAMEHGACIPAISVVDTLKKVDSCGFVINTMNRDNLYQAQTPQAFELELILKAHEYAKEPLFSGTDDASLVEKMGNNVFITEGSKENIKITTRGDLELAEIFAARFNS
ncbi:MAG: 2-C-methyl-D-erythritol 4-phosphate cytidylyltransferase [Thermodesulfobacteriota bacterium]|nr:2-C-methyl-D-erythritol 4-phosphate cytidylyltransferase [Thermodesulfobacteriota bacterium]